MNNTAEQWFDYEKVLTETDILEIAKKIGETRKKIDEIEEARKTLKNLQQEKLTLERQLEQGKATGHFNGIHSYHDPEEGLVTICPNPKVDWRPNSFTPFTREMTQAEKEKYCQRELEFDEEEENKVREETIDDVAATILDQIDYDHYDPGTFVPDDDELDEIEEIEDEAREETDQLIDTIPVYKSVKTGEYFLMDNEGERLLLIVSSQNSSIINFIDPFDNEEIILKRHEDIRLRDEELQEPIPNISVPVEPEQLSKVKVWKALNGGYFVFNEQQNPVPLKVLNSLENVVFLEQEGVDGVILKRHSEIIPSAINL